MIHRERRVLVAQPFPRIDARHIYAGKSWAGCYIRDPDEHRWKQRAPDQYIDSPDDIEDIEDYRRFLEGMLPRTRGQGQPRRD